MGLGLNEFRLDLTGAELSALPRKIGGTSMSDSLIPNNNINAFDEVIAIIENARENAFRAVNRELINMYRDIGEYVSQRVTDSGWGKSVVKDFSAFIQRRYVGIKGFSPSNIWRMKQFYETYSDNEKLATLSRELTWSHNLQIMSCRSDEEREFYLTLSVRNRYSFRELKRQMDSGMYERTMVRDYQQADNRTQRGADSPSRQLCA
jgi:hypothetical protein